jgi:hypothetical protein
MRLVVVQIVARLAKNVTRKRLPRLMVSSGDLFRIRINISYDGISKMSRDKWLKLRRLLPQDKSVQTLKASMGFMGAFLYSFVMGLWYLRSIFAVTRLFVCPLHKSNMSNRCVAIFLPAVRRNKAVHHINRGGGE